MGTLVLGEPEKTQIKQETMSPLRKELHDKATDARNTKSAKLVKSIVDNIITGARIESECGRFHLVYVYDILRDHGLRPITEIENAIINDIKEQGLEIRGSIKSIQNEYGILAWRCDFIIEW